MSENTTNLLKRWWFFISRLFILGGMALFFSSLAYILIAYCCKWLLGVDLINQPELVNQFGSDPKILNALKLLQAGLTIGMMVIPAILFPKALERDPAQFLQLRTPVKPLHLLIAIVMVVASTPMVSWMVEWNEGMTLPPEFADLEASLKKSEAMAGQLTRAFLRGTTFSDLFINLVVVAVIPALAEELLFRGALQQFFRLVFNNVHIAVISTAIIFSAIHGQFYGFLPRFALGVLLGYLFVYSGSIWPSVLVHLLNNGISVCITHFKWDQSSAVLFSEEYHFSAVWVILSMVACVGLVLILFKTKAQHATQLEPNF